MVRRRHSLHFLHSTMLANNGLLLGYLVGQFRRVGQWIHRVASKIWDFILKFFQILAQILTSSFDGWEFIATNTACRLALQPAMDTLGMIHMSTGQERNSAVDYVIFMANQTGWIVGINIS